LFHYEKASCPFLRHYLYQLYRYVRPDGPDQLIHPSLSGLICIYLCAMHDAIQIRPIQPGDNPAIAAIIRNTLKEFGGDRPGTVFTDPTTDALYELFRKPGSSYNIALLNDTIVGGAGIYPSDGLPEGTCELVKMYLLPEARGVGLGKFLIEKALQFARESGYRQVYIETLPELRQAMSVYEKFGFKYLDGPLGNTGHFGCDIWMLKEL
jgi:putative acetyltransferase